MRGTANKGKAIRQVNLGCVQPGESTATFGDALPRLQNKARYLHMDGEPTFYDPAQNISRDAESRKDDFSHLASLHGSKAEVTLDIEVRIPEGVPDNVVRTVTENCRTLKFNNQGFEAV